MIHFKVEKTLIFLKIVDKKRKMLFLALKFALFCLNKVVKKFQFQMVHLVTTSTILKNIFVFLFQTIFSKIIMPIFVALRVCNIFLCTI